MKFQPELDKAQMMWRRISSYKSKFTSEKFQVGDLNQFLTHTHMPVFLVLILDFGLPVHCWDTELWFFFPDVPSGTEGTASNCLRAYRITRLTKAAVLNAPACCFHQDLWTRTVAPLGHCSVSEFERSLPPTAQGYRAKGTELLPWKLRCCALKRCWNFGTQVRAFSAVQDEKLLFMLQKKLLLTAVVSNGYHYFAVPQITW